MNDSHLDEQALDALLDETEHGEAAHDGPFADHISQCADCRARLDALKQVRLLLAAPVAMPDIDVRNAAVSRAAAEWESSNPQVERRPWFQRAALPVTAIAAVLLVVLTLPSLLNGNEAPSNNAQESDEPDRARKALPNAGPPADVSQSSDSVYGGDLGEFDDSAELSKAINERSTSPAPRSESGLPAIALDAAEPEADCLSTLQDTPQFKANIATFTAALDWKGTPSRAYVLVHSENAEAADGTLVVTTKADCEVIFTEPIRLK